MTGCCGVSGAVTWLSVNAWYISNDICYTRNSRSGLHVIAMAICCEIVTAAPTINPTGYPTVNPTNVPTIKPTVYPTNDPTSSPSTKLPSSNAPHTVSPTKSP
eukprot:305002_1